MGRERFWCRLVGRTVRACVAATVIVAMVSAILVNAPSAYANTAPSSFSVVVSGRGTTTLKLRDGGRLIIPVGALRAGSKVEARYGDAPMGRSVSTSPLGQALRFSVTPRARFAKPLTLELPMSVPSYREAAGFGVFRIATLDTSTDTWLKVTTAYNPKTHMLMALLPHLSVWSIVTEFGSYAKDVADCLVSSGDALDFFGCLIKDGYDDEVTSALTSILSDLLPKTCWAALVQADVIGAITGSDAVAAFAVFKAAFLSKDACTGTAGSGGSGGSGGVPAPVVESISPTSGPSGGGTTVTISGDYFATASSVSFGGTSANFAVLVNSDTSITATAPPHPAGNVAVTVSDGGGTSSVSSLDTYTYKAVSPTPTPSPGPTSGAISIGWSNSHPNWIYMTLTGFAPGDYTYTCDFGSGGDQSYGLDGDQQPRDHRQR